jgi:hypothetical protein
MGADIETQVARMDERGVEAQQPPGAERHAVIHQDRPDQAVGFGERSHNPIREVLRFGPKDESTKDTKFIKLQEIYLCFFVSFVEDPFGGIN